ncbi:hypothetical protein BST95_00445 [Halioglobus japonicus]|uniref:Uncharacterized protein n=1 Tax=Halioglobus japonicus TaxID=930805 RepID=A0AAP8MBX0_9GAMM|nr:hypothetical protein BST95_00445 [Halioglobus japonicus]KZX51237.1 hypothetical protein A3709_10425 [Halioglobus sp. HI00S01]PLW84799.1 hypothetical protein C0029_17520 [Halioglobus japonicus]GHD21487.1 hypothetical protein GCM10007052_32310 [Halioglobus japonicus]
MVARAAVVSLLVVACGTAFSAATRIPADFKYTNLSTEVSFWGHNDYRPTPDTREATAAGIANLVNQYPQNADYHVLAARTYEWLAYFTFNPEAAVGYRQQSKNYQELAIKLRPAHSYSREVGGPRFRNPVN